MLRAPSLRLFSAARVGSHEILQAKYLQRPAAAGAEVRVGRVGLVALRAGGQRTCLPRCWHVFGHVRRLAPAGGRDPRPRRNSGSLYGIKLAPSPRHEEALEEAEKTRNRGGAGYPDS